MHTQQIQQTRRVMHTPVRHIRRQTSRTSHSGRCVHVPELPIAPLRHPPPQRQKPLAAPQHVRIADAAMQQAQVLYGPGAGEGHDRRCMNLSTLSRSLSCFSRCAPGATSHDSASTTGSTTLGTSATCTDPQNFMGTGVPVPGMQGTRRQDMLNNARDRTSKKTGGPYLNRYRHDAAALLHAIRAPRFRLHR